MASGDELSTVAWPTTRAWQPNGNLFYARPHLFPNLRWFLHSSSEDGRCEKVMSISPLPITIFSMSASTIFRLSSVGKDGQPSVRRRRCLKRRGWRGRNGASRTSAGRTDGGFRGWTVITIRTSGVITSRRKVWKQPLKRKKPRL